MKITWKKTQSNTARKRKIVDSNLPFDYATSDAHTSAAAEPLEEPEDSRNHSDVGGEGTNNIAQEFEAQGNKLAEEGKYREALSKWETAITLIPGRAVLHEQKAQVLLELGDAWNALKAAARAAELEPTWAEAWITVGRAQLNYGEPDSSIESFDKALAIKPDFEDAKDDRKTALHLVKRRKQLHSTGLSSNESRFLVGDQG
ncbi:uncharacterized protein [Henckelia pumila]|uniref:uncharacterized protein n=1 Tax=Henckelia pumila TaxID=405737 RepID=UPI003C6DDC37